MEIGNLVTRAINRGDDVAQLFGAGGTVKILYETADANANYLSVIFPEGGAVDVPAFVIGDASIDNVDTAVLNGLTEPSYVVFNDAGDAYVSLDAGDDAVAGSKGLYFKSAADEDIEIINLSPTGTPRIYWDESEDQVRSTKGWIFDAACDVQGTWVATAAWTLPAFTLGGTVTVNAQTLAAGANTVLITTTAAWGGIDITNTINSTTGVGIAMRMLDATPVVDTSIARIFGTQKSSAGTERVFGTIYLLSRDITDGSEDGEWGLYLIAAGVENEALRLSSVGVLSVDLAGVGTAAQVDLFDEYDDALVLRQGIQQNNRELLADIGVLTRKDTGSGYFLNLQPMVRLLAGGIYQSRTMIEEMLTRLDSIEQKQNRLGQGG